MPNNLLLATTKQKKKTGAGSAPKGKGISGGPAGSESVSLVDDRQWKAKSALDDIARAHKHQSDPILMGDVVSHVESLRKIAKAAHRKSQQVTKIGMSLPKKDKNLK
jgi:hypothetical protein